MLSPYDISWTLYAILAEDIQPTAGGMGEIVSVSAFYLRDYPMAGRKAEIAIGWAVDHQDMNRSRRSISTKKGDNLIAGSI